MRKRSRLSSDIAESGKGCDCHMELVIEWTFEGRAELVGFDGDAPLQA